MDHQKLDAIEAWADRIVYHRPTDKGLAAIAEFRRVVREAGESIINFAPEGREKALALTKLEEALFWANAAVARAMNNDYKGPPLP